jgi:arginase
MDVQALIVPYDSGHRAERMGRGPLHFQARGLHDVLVSAGYGAHIETIESAETFHAEVRTAFELHRLIAAQVGKAVEQGRFPLLFSGNCNSTIGSITALHPQDIGVVWLDAHGEFNTPETSGSGFFDGMGLAIATGRCWQTAAALTPGFVPLREENIVLIGGRDFDTLEEQMLDESAINVVRAGDVHAAGMNAVSAALDRLNVQRVYLHVDFDSLDPSIAPANPFPAPDGLSIEQAEAIIAQVGERFQIAGASFASYDPSYDVEDRMLNAGFRLMRAILAQV